MCTHVDHYLAIKETAVFERDSRTVVKNVIWKIQRPCMLEGETERRFAPDNNICWVCKNKDRIKRANIQRKTKGKYDLPHPVSLFVTSADTC